ncbi:TPA: hypothetical protein HL370_15405 [Escherichia coli]|nr:hypothetical protein [Escherichia coli]
MSIKNDGHYFCRAGGNRPDGLNEPVTIVVHGHRDSIFKENTIQQCTCTVSIILAISIKALARALSFSETLHAAFRFSF